MSESDLERMSRRMDQVVSRLLGRHFAEFCPSHVWMPPVNVYLTADRAEVCVELAGVRRDDIDLHVEPRRLTLRGRRHAPHPGAAEDQPVQLVSMEINHGPFERTVLLPREVDIAAVEARIADGLMWITLPWKRRAR